jgi:hypothetical protein
MLHLKRNITTAYEPHRAQNDQTNGTAEFSQPYCFIAADELLEMGTAAISALLSQMSTHHRPALPVSQNFVTSRCNVCLIRHFITRLRIPKYFRNSIKRLWYEWTHAVLVNTSCSHLRSFRATGVGSGLAARVTLTRVSRKSVENLISDFIFVSHGVVTVVLLFKLYTLY